MQVQLDLSTVEAERESTVDLLPAGSYISQIVSVEGKETNSKQGHYFEVLFKVLEGEHKDKRFKDRLNIVHSNQDTSRISQARLKGILAKGGHKNPNYLGNTDEMVNLVVEARLEIKDYIDKSGEARKSNDVKGYKAVGNAVAGGVSIAPAVAPVAPIAAPVAPVLAAPVAPPVIAAPTPAPTPAAPAVVAAPAAAGAFPWGTPT